LRRAPCSLRAGTPTAGRSGNPAASACRAIIPPSRSHVHPYSFSCSPVPLLSSPTQLPPTPLHTFPTLDSHAANFFGSTARRGGLASFPFPPSRPPRQTPLSFPRKIVIPVATETGIQYVISVKTGTVIQSFPCCHSRERLSSPWQRGRESSYPSPVRSFHSGLSLSISSIFQARFHFLICFSLAIAAVTSLYLS